MEYDSELKEPIISRKMMTNFCAETEKFSIFQERKMADLNQQRFILATDKIIEQLRNGAENVNTSKSATFRTVQRFDILSGRRGARKRVLFLKWRNTNWPG